MVKILDLGLHVEHLNGRPGERRLVVTYSIDAPPNDPMIGSVLSEHVTVSSRDEHDAPVFPTDLDVRLLGEVTLEQGIAARALTTDVHRVDLDVEQDWGRINEGGGFEPIAEFVDHLVAEVTLMLGNEPVATAVSPTVTGSWGALGAD